MADAGFATLGGMLAVGSSEMSRGARRAAMADAGWAAHGGMIAVGSSDSSDHFHHPMEVEP